MYGYIYMYYVGNFLKEDEKEHGEIVFCRKVSNFISESE